MKPEYSNRLKETLDDKGWTQKELSVRSGVDYPNVHQYVSGKVSQPRGDNLKKIAKVLDVEYIWLLTGEKEGVEIPITMYLSNNWEILPVANDDRQTIKAPSALITEEAVAVAVQGDSAFPVYEHGTILFYSKKMHPIDLINKKAICKIADGRIVLKIIRYGKTSDLFTLQSINMSHPDITNVNLKWAAPIDWIKPAY